MSKIPDQRLAYSRTDAARMLGVSVKHVQRLEKRGQLRPSRIGGRVVIPHAELERLLEEGQQVAA